MLFYNKKERSIVFDATNASEGFELGRVWSVLEQRHVQFVIEFAYDMDDHPRNSPKTNTDIRLKIPLSSFLQSKTTTKGKKKNKRTKRVHTRKC